MELQPRQVSSAIFGGPQYQYKPPEDKNGPIKLYLQLYYKSSPQQSFVSLIQSLFNDRSLYHNKKFRKTIQATHKGYFPLSDILQHSLVKKFVAEVNESDDIDINQSALLSCIKKLSDKLICCRNKIRRKHKFVNQIKDTKPIYIEQYPEIDCNEQLQTLLENATTIYKINYKHQQNWALIYCQNPNKITQLHGHFWSIKTHLKVMSYSQGKSTFDSPFRNIQSENGWKKSFFRINKNNRKTGYEIEEPNFQRRHEKHRQLQTLKQYLPLNLDDEMNQRFMHEIENYQQMMGKKTKFKKQDRQRQKKRIYHLFPNLSLNRDGLTSIMTKQIQKKVFQDTDMKRDFTLTQQDEDIVNQIIFKDYLGNKKEFEDQNYDKQKQNRPKLINRKMELE